VRAWSNSMWTGFSDALCENGDERSDSVKVQRFLEQSVVQSAKEVT
jgi:hypothetical protein